MRLFCLLNQHKPIQKGVSWQHPTYVGHCARCGKEIERVRKGSWVARSNAPRSG